MYANTRSNAAVTAWTVLMYIAILVVITVAIRMTVLQTSHTIDQTRIGMSEVLESITAEHVGQELR